MKLRNKLGLKGKTTLGLGALLLLALLVMGGAVFYQAMTLAIGELLESTEKDIGKDTIEIENIVESSKNDLMVISEMPAVQGFIRASHNGGIDPLFRVNAEFWLARVEEIFSDFLKYNHEYYQLRYIDEKGNEIVRVDRIGNALKTTPRKELHNKSQYPYFRETMKLMEDEVYYSEINLNRDHGVIQIPHTPVFRIATPVFDAEKRAMGVVVMKLYRDTLFSNIRLANGETREYVVNQDGYLLVHPDRSKEFGFDLGFEYTAKNVMHESSDEMKTLDRSVKYHKQDRHVDGFKKIFFDPLNKSRYWAIFHVIPEKVALKNVYLARNTMFGVGFAIIAGSLIIITGLTRRKLVTPILNLSAAVKTIESGDLAARTSGDVGSGEMRELGLSINRMAHSIEKNINERRRAELQLKAAMAFSDDLINSVPGILFCFNVEGRFLRWNSMLETSLEYSREAIAGMHPLEMVAPEDRARAEESIKETFRLGKADNELKLLTGGGRRVPYQILCRAISVGSLPALLGVGIDITARKEAEDKVKEYAGTLEIRVEDRTTELKSANRELENRQTEHLALLQASRSVLELKGFNAIARSIFDSCKKTIGATAGYVAMLSKDETRNELLFLDAGGRPCTVDRSLPMPIRGLREKAYHAGKTVFENDFPGSEWAGLMPKGHVRLDNVLFAPLIIEGKAHGVIGFANKPGGFTENDVRTVSAFAELAAIALLNTKMQESLKNSEERFRSVVQTTTVAIVNIDEYGKIVFWNKAAESMFGYSVAEALGRLITLIIPERLRNGHLRGVDRILSIGESKIIGKTIETTGLRKNGSEIPLELSVSSWETREGRFFTGILHDITERIQKEKQYEAMTTTSMDGFWLVDTQGRLLDVNDAYCQLSGYTREELLTMRIQDVESREEAEDTKQHVQKILETGYDRFETQHRCKDSKIIDVEVSANYVKLDRDLLVVFLRDITERKRYEKEVLTAKDVADTANRAKSDFLANMSHELRTPLNAILGFSDILVSGMTGPLTNKQNEFINDILGSGQHLLSLINDILDLSKVEAGKMELELSEFDLGELIDGSLVMFKEKAMKHAIKLSAKVEADSGGPIRADERKIRQVLFNLLSNAMKFTPDGGSVAVQVRALRQAQGDCFIEISVTDTGPGISAENQKRLFQPFQQLDTDITWKVAGTGLGLSLCKSFVELHGGRIRVKSEPGLGSTFLFLLPIAQGEPRES